jgi:hypothetical protein
MEPEGLACHEESSKSSVWSPLLLRSEPRHAEPHVEWKGRLGTMPRMVWMAGMKVTEGSWVSWVVSRRRGSEPSVVK